MPAYPTVLFSFCLIAVLGSGCSKENPVSVDATAAPSATATGTMAVTPDSKQHVNACDMVTQSEMSAILGGEVTAAPGGNDRPPSSTECIYSQVDGWRPDVEPTSFAEMQAAPGPYAELQVDWGGGDIQALGTAAGLAQTAAPAGAVDPLAGLGDRAYQVTADQVFISTQGDLIMIRFPPRSSEVVAKARRIYETAKPRM